MYHLTWFKASSSRSVGSASTLYSPHHGFSSFSGLKRLILRLTFIAGIHPSSRRQQKIELRNSKLESRNSTFQTRSCYSFGWLQLPNFDLRLGYTLRSLFCCASFEFRFSSFDLRVSNFEFRFSVFPFLRLELRNCPHLVSVFVLTMCLLR